MQDVGFWRRGTARGHQRDVDERIGRGAEQDCWELSKCSLWIFQAEQGGISRMRPARFFDVSLLCCFSVFGLFSGRLLAGFDATGRHEVASSMMFLAGQAKPNPSPAGNQQANLYREVIAHKGAIKWRPAPPPGIPA